MLESQKLWEASYSCRCAINSVVPPCPSVRFFLCRPTIAVYEIHQRAYRVAEYLRLKCYKMYLVQICKCRKRVVKFTVTSDKMCVCYVKLVQRAIISLQWVTSLMSSIAFLAACRICTYFMLWHYIYKRI